MQAYVPYLKWLIRALLTIVELLECSSEPIVDDEKSTRILGYPAGVDAAPDEHGWPGGGR